MNWEGHNCIRQHMSTLVNTCQRIPAKCCIWSGEDLKWCWKRSGMTGWIDGRANYFCMVGNELCRNEPYSRRISSFLHNLLHKYTKICTQALYQNLRAELELMAGFEPATSSLPTRAERPASPVFGGQWTNRNHNISRQNRLYYIMLLSIHYGAWACLSNNRVPTEPFEATTHHHWATSEHHRATIIGEVTSWLRRFSCL